MIDRACIFPPIETIKEFSKALEKHYMKEKVNIIETFQKFEDLAKIDGLYFSKDLSNFYEIAKYLADIKEADITMQYYFCISPAKISNIVLQNMKFYLRQLCIVKTVRLPSNYHLENNIFTKKSYNMNELYFFEDIHNSLEVYIWLSYKFEIEFIERDLAMVLKDRVCKIIDSIIEKQAFDSMSDLKNESRKSGEAGSFKLLENLNKEQNEEKNTMRFTQIKPRKSTTFIEEEIDV